MCEETETGYPNVRTGLPQSVPRLQARRRARFAGSFVCSQVVFEACLGVWAREQGSQRAASTGRPSTVAIRADDLALLDLGEDRRPSLRGELATDRERLVAQMVELENDRVGLPTVDAGMQTEVLEE